MKKSISLILIFIMLLSCFVSCGEAKPETDTDAIPRAYDSGKFGGKAVGSLKIEGTDISEYTIIYGRKSEFPAEKTAATELADYIKKAAGIELPVKDDTAEKSAHEILIGHTNRDDGIDRSGLGDEGFTIRTLFDGTLVITGGGPRGTIYGVYDFLEEEIGWRFLTVDCEVIYQISEINLVSLDRTELPAMRYRASAWNCNTNARTATQLKKYAGACTEEFGGHDTFAGAWCHSMAYYIPESAGKQPCLTDPEIFDRVLEGVKKDLAANPTANTISVSPNDFYGFCTCENCAKIDEEEGSNAGTLVRFVNAIADAIKDDYPDVLVHTLAYQYSRKPTVTKPRDNVLVQYCTIERCTAHAFDDPACEVNAAMKEELEGWLKIAKNVSIWDYHLNTGTFLVQVPNLELLGKDMSYFASLGVYGVYGQGDGNDCDFGFNSLRSYVVPKILWNGPVTEEEYDEMVKEFMRGYYGDGWEYIYNYMKYFDECGANKEFLDVGPEAMVAFTDEEVLAKKDEISEGFAKAKELAENDLVKHHIRLCELHWLCHLSTAEYDTEVMNAFFDQPDQYQTILDAWAEKNGELIKELFDNGICHFSDQIEAGTNYAERYKYSIPFEVNG